MILYILTKQDYKIELVNIKNAIASLIKQPLSVDCTNVSGLFSYGIHNLAASWISDDIALCVVGSGDCRLKYKKIADSLGITREEIDEYDIRNIKTKLESATREECHPLHQLRVNFHKSLEEYNKLSFWEILNKSVEQMLEPSVLANSKSKSQSDMESFPKIGDSEEVTVNSGRETIAIVTDSQIDDLEKYRYDNSEGEIFGV